MVHKSLLNKLSWNQSVSCVINLLGEFTQTWTNIEQILTRKALLVSDSWYSFWIIVPPILTGLWLCHFGVLITWNVVTANNLQLLNVPVYISELISSIFGHG